MESQTISRKKRYQKFLETLRYLLQREKTVQKNLLQIKHEIGLLLLTEKEKLEYGDIFEFLKAVAKDLDYSWGELYRCTRFAEKYPRLDVFLSKEFELTEKSETGTFDTVTKVGGELTWHEVANEPGVLVPPRSPEEGKKERATDCIFNSPNCAGECSNVILCAVDLAEFQTWRNERKNLPQP